SIALIAGLGAYVSHTQSQARGVLRDELGQRAEFTGRLLSGALMTSVSPEALKMFGGPRSTLPAIIKQVDGMGATRVVVLDARGRVIAASSPDITRDPGPVVNSPHVQA